MRLINPQHDLRTEVEENLIGYKRAFEVQKPVLSKISGPGADFIVGSMSELIQKMDDFVAFKFELTENELDNLVYQIQELGQECNELYQSETGKGVYLDENNTPVVLKEDEIR